MLTPQRKELVGVERALEFNMIRAIDVLLIWLVCYAAARAVTTLEQRAKPTAEEERQQYLDELSGRW